MQTTKNFLDNLSFPTNRPQFHSLIEEYGLQIDLQNHAASPSSAATGSRETDAESVNVCGMIFKADPLTRELVLCGFHHLYESKYLEQNSIRPGDILCKVN